LEKIIKSIFFQHTAFERCVDLYGTAVLLEEVGKVIKKGGDGGATVSYYYGKMC